VKTIISIGDFIDIYFKIRSLGSNKFLSRLIPSSNKKRITKAWNSASGNTQSNWWAVPYVQKRWNSIITGDANTDYYAFIIEKYLKDKKDIKLLSPGCGTGSKELKFAKFDNLKSIEAFDISSERIKVAIENVERLGLKNIRYKIADVQSFKFEKDYYDIIIFDSFLHHIKNIDDILIKIYDSLKEDGILVINEYVGPNRFQWSKEQLDISNNALNKIPHLFRRRENSNKVKRKNYRPGLLRMILSDPSEAINSENILQKIRLKFNVLEEKPYGGNILHLTLKDISHNFIIESDECKKLLDALFKIEDDFLQRIKESDFIFGVYSKHTFNQL
jgi:ubiquinone/menaquinone biosynthesis C-methylase UbiE